jgi:hypothetical protein
MQLGLREVIMRGVSGLLVLAMASGVVWAQGNAQIGPTTFMAAPVSTGCPVGFSAERQAARAVRYAKGEPVQTHGQGLELKFDPQNDPRKIVKVNITVHGIDGSARVIPAGEKSSDSVAELFELTAAGDNSLRHSNVWTRGINVIQWVDLTEVAYADGSVWLASASGRCRVEPNGFLLVAGAR